MAIIKSWKNAMVNSICGMLILVVAPALGQTSELTKISVGAVPLQKSLQMPWRNTIAVGRAHNLLRADMQAHLAYAQQVMGYRYCRFHAIFDDEMDVVRRDKNTGKLIFNWHQVDKVYDALLKIGIRPFVELNPMPKALASGTQTMFFYEMNVTPPKSYEEWGQLVEAFTQHMVDRYGIEEVRKWYFEVWNEPNLGAFWAGTQQEYWKLYTASAKAVKKVDAALRIGGPATASAAWVNDIIEYCYQSKVPLDFVSTHLYPQDEQVFYPDRKNSPYKVGEYFSAKFKEVDATVKKSKMPHLEIHWTEWNTQSAATADKVTWGENIYVDNLFAASFIVKNALEVDSICQSMAYWVVSDIFDEGGIPQSPFSTTYGLMTIHGIPKASFNAFAFLRKMTGQVLPLSYSAPAEAGKGLVATQDGQRINLLLYHQSFVEEKPGKPWTVKVEVPLKGDTLFSVVRASIRPGAGSAWESWQLMGRPLNLSPAQLALLQQHAIPAHTYSLVSVKDKPALLEFTLQPGEVVYVELSPLGQTTTTRFADPEAFKIWDAGMTERSKQ